MKINDTRLLFGLLLALPACGGGGGGGSSGPAPVSAPSNLVYSANQAFEISQVEVAPLLPTVDGEVDTFTVVPPLPAGLELDPQTGVIAGAATSPSARRTYDIAANNAGGSAHFTLTLTVVAPPRFVYSVSSSDNSVSVFANDVFSGELTRAGHVVTGGIDAAPERLYFHPNGRFAYAPNMTSGTVSVFDIDPDSGALSKKASAVCGVGPHVVAIDPNGSFAYVANRGANQICVFAIDPANGELTLTGAPTVTGPQPSTAEFDPTGTILFVTTRGEEPDGFGSSIATYSKNALTGALTQLATLKLNGGRPIALCVDRTKRVVYITLDAFDAVLPLRYDMNGALHPVSLRHAGQNPVSVEIHASGQFAYVVNQGDDTIDAYHVDPSTSALSMFATYGVGAAPASIAVDPTGQFAYVASRDSRELITYSIDPSTGALANVGSRIVRGLPEHVSILTGDRPLVSTPRFVHVAGQNSNDVTSYTVDPANGALTQASVVSVGTKPSSLVIDPRQRFAWVANETSGTISIFALDATSGALTNSLPAQAIAGQPTRLAVDPSARFLYAVAHDVATPNDGWLTTYAISAASGALTQVDTQEIGLHPTSVAIDPTGRFAYTANNADGTISVFALDGTTGVPTVSAPSSVAPGVYDFAFHPNGRYVYGVLNGSGVITMYAIAASNGQLTLVPPGIESEPEPTALAFTANGRFAFASAFDTSGGGSLTRYDVGLDAQLGTAAQTVLDGLHPTGVALDPRGKFLYASNFGSDSVSVVRLDATTGAMTVGTPVATGVMPIAITLTSTTH